MNIYRKSIVTGEINNFFSYYGWPSICKDENDVLYAVCSGHRMGHVCPFGKTYLYKSRNKGDTWSNPIVVDDSYFDDRDAGIVYLGNGKMLATNFKHPVSFYEQNYKEGFIRDHGKLAAEMLSLCTTLPEEDQKGGSFYLLSDDYGESWGKKTRIPVSCPHGPILLSSGELLYIGKEMYSYGAEEEWTIHAYLSSPGEVSFSKLSSLNKPDKYPWYIFHEPHCVELENGNILAYYRAQIDPIDGSNFTMVQTVSKDKGKTWSTPEETGICGSPPHLLKLADGKVLLTYARRMEPFGIYARILEKDGTIGDEEILIDPASGSDIGYPASVQMEDGSFVTVFYKREISKQYTSIVSVHWDI